MTPQPSEVDQLASGPLASVGQRILDQIPAMPFRLIVANDGIPRLQSVPLPHPDPQDVALAQAALDASRTFGSLAELGEENDTGELQTYAVATHNPETAQRLKAFVGALREEG